MTSSEKIQIVGEVGNKDGYVLRDIQTGASFHVLSGDPSQTSETNPIVIDPEDSLEIWGPIIHELTRAGGVPVWAQLGQHIFHIDQETTEIVDIRLAEDTATQ
jgi:hypothetical protein